MEINATEFRQRCFEILESVKTTHKEIVITRRGKPIAKLTRISQAGEKDPLLGALSGSGRTVGDLTEPATDATDWEID